MTRGRSWSIATLKDEDDEPDTQLVAVLAVPSYMTSSDFLIFVGAKVVETLEGLRMLRDSMPNRCVALLRFQTSQAANKFIKLFNGKPFTGNPESEICHAVPLASFEISQLSTPPHSTSTSFFSPSPIPTPPLSRGEKERYELPTCPICLERMDSSVTGLQTPVCRHGGSCSCLSRWGDGNCPVCRLSMSEPPKELSCSSCLLSENLWICLICGHVGCGRYQSRHAQGHFAQEGHGFAMEVVPGTGRVWDYSGDGYVHRLVRNRTDGKIVELPTSFAASTTEDQLQRSPGGGGGGPDRRMMANQEKIEAIGLEYSYLLTSQLDSQRDFYDELVRGLRSQLDAARKGIDEERRKRKEVEEMWQREVEEEKEETEAVTKLEKELKKAKERGERFLADKQALEKSLETERLVNRGLIENLKALKATNVDLDQQVTRFQAEVQDLQEQVRDVMVALEMRERIEKEIEKGEEGEESIREIEGGSVFVPPETTSSKKKSKKKKK
ncbi:zf-UBP-domain-containing protein [Atractiella rhizophila]|nr:zf-UBP-domain-containing protein [Atractiella rhizophila]